MQIEQTSSTDDLILFICCGNIKAVKRMLDRGVDMNDIYLEKSLLCRHIKITKLLLEAGANVQTVSDEVLRKLFMNGCYEQIIFLVDKGINISRYLNDDMLIHNVLSGDIDIVKFLLENGPIYHIKDEALKSVSNVFNGLRNHPLGGSFPQHVLDLYLQITILLLKYGADVDVINNEIYDQTSSQIKEVIDIYRRPEKISLQFKAHSMITEQEAKDYIKNKIFSLGVWEMSFPLNIFDYKNSTRDMKWST